ncbi:MAG: ABC transporter permease subunit [Phycisphaerales bacterium]
MTLRERLSRLDHLQRTTIFKVVASGVVVALALIAVIGYAVRQNMPSGNGESLYVMPPEDAPVVVDPQASPEEMQAQDAAAQMQRVMRSNEAATERILNDVLAARQDWGGFAGGVIVVAALCLAVIWMGLALTYLAVVICAGVIVWPLSMIEATRTFSIIGAGCALLTLAFAALLRGANLLLSASNPILAVARNTLAEAVRMRVGIMFIVMLIFALAALPTLLDDQQPLRYRIQSFLQYSVGGSFWMTALLVLSFATASVCFEQRDKTIWQTITKPVTHAQYLLGKWVGVVTLAAVLLMVCGAAIFMFTEYLRDQRAQGESEAYVAKEGGGLTEDRKVLEMQVLTAREKVMSSEPEVDEEQFAKNLEERVQQEIAYLSQYDDATRELRVQQEQEIRERLSEELRKSIGVAYRAIAPGGERIYRFEGLLDAKRENRPVILRFKVEAGSNMPDQLYRLTLQFPNNYPFVETVGLNQFHTIELLPTVIDENGLLELRVQNGDSLSGRMNPETLIFSKDGLEVTYSVGGYRMNYLRVMLVLWIKLGFLAMIAICASTALSFPVACLVSFTVFLSAEGASFILGALEVYQTEGDKGEMLLIPTIISYVADSVASTFKIYADLQPVPRLVGGLLLSWGSVVMGAAVLMLMTTVLYVASVIVFKRRELATYSGQ